MSEKRTALEVERRGLVDKIEELDDVRRRHESRRDLLEARRQDIEETAGLALPRGAHGARRRAAEGPRRGGARDSSAPSSRRSGRSPMPSCTTIADRALADAPRGRRARSSRSPPAVRCRSGWPASGSCSPPSTRQPAARGIASTVLRRRVPRRDRRARRPRSSGSILGASFVTPDGVLVGPAVIHTAGQADARARGRSARSCRWLPTTSRRPCNALQPQA